MTPYEELVSFILPEEIFESFEVKKTEVKVDGNERVMYIHLDEFDLTPVFDVELFPNGFCDVSRITDFPIRDRKVVLLVRRRRWKDAEGRSYSNDWSLAAKGTRISKEFAAFKRVVSKNGRSRPSPSNFLSTSRATTSKEHTEST